MANLEKEVSVNGFIEVLQRADAISIDGSPLLSDWNLNDSDDAVIDTKWNEDEGEYECFIQDIEKIIFGSDSSFHVYHEANTVTRIKLFSIKVLS